MINIVMIMGNWDKSRMNFELSQPLSISKIPVEIRVDMKRYSLISCDSDFAPTNRNSTRTRDKKEEMEETQKG